MSEQYGFYYDAGRCVQCRTCELACKNTYNVEPGVKWRRVMETWSGEYPDVARRFFSLACLHCQEPACAAVCPTGAISKRAGDGIVVVDREKCNGCGDCRPACPYGVPQFGADGTMQKCNYCLGTGRGPACAASCPAEALHYGTMEELLQKAAAKEGRRLDGATGPSLVVAGPVPDF